MLNRRAFISSAVGVALSPLLHALPGDKFRWAISSHMFTPLKPHPETGVKMAARFGFHGIEPWANELQSYLKQSPEAFKRVLDESGIGISSVASGGEYFDTAKLPATLDNNGSNAKFAAYFGVTALQANLGRRPSLDNLSVANAKMPRSRVGSRVLPYAALISVRSAR